MSFSKWAVVVEHVQEQGPGVQIDATVKSVGLGVQSHSFWLSKDGSNRSPLRGCRRHKHGLKDPRWDTVDIVILLFHWERS